METSQDVCLFSRKRMELSGVEEVESFTDEQIIAASTLGMIAVEGRGLKIESFSTERGELKINGEVDSFYYYNKKKSDEKHGVIAKLFR